MNFKYFRKMTLAIRQKIITAQTLIRACSANNRRYFIPLKRKNTDAEHEIFYEAFLQNLLKEVEVKCYDRICQLGKRRIEK